MNLDEQMEVLEIKTVINRPEILPGSSVSNGQKKTLQKYSRGSCLYYLRKENFKKMSFIFLTVNGPTCTPFQKQFHRVFDSPFLLNWFTKKGERTLRYDTVLRVVRSFSHKEL